jgi:DivIVA domain-containing protein
MALLTADDVLNKKFQATKFREGYDQDEVDDFLDEVVNTLRAVQAEKEELETKLAAAERRVAELSRAGASADVEDAAQPTETHAAPAAAAPAAPAATAAVPASDAPAPAESAPAESAPAESAPAESAPAESAPAAARQSEPESATAMLQLAQKVHDDYVRSGKEESDRLINEAKAQSTRIVREAEETSHRTLSSLEQERSLLERKIDELRVFERDYRTRLKSYLENLLGDLDNRGSALPPPRPEAADSAAASL